MYSSFCYALNHSKYIKTFVFILLLFFILFSAVVSPIQQAQAFVFAPLAVEGANIIFDLSVAGLVGAGVIAADTEIKKSDQYKFVMSYLSYCTDKELERLADLASTAGEVATSAISDLLALMLGTFGTATIDVQNYGTMPSWLPPPASFIPSGTYYYFIDKSSSTMYFHMFDAPFELLDDPTDSRYIKIIYHGSGVGYSVSHSSADFSGCSWGTTSYRDGQAFYFTPDRILSTGAIAVGTVLNPGIDLSKPISLTDTFAIPSDVQTCDDSWANDDTYKVAYPPWLADMDVSGDVVINPSLDHAGEGEGDIGGDVTGDLTADGSAISGAITGLWDWLKGILQSILDAIKSIPAFLQSIIDAVKALPGLIASALSSALTAILDAIGALAGAIAEAFQGVLTWAFIPEEGYFKGKYEVLEKLLNARFGTVAIDLTGLTGDKSFDDITVTIFGSTVTIVSFASVETALDFFRPVIVGFIGVLGLIYNYNNLYRLVKGTSYVSSSGGDGDSKKGKKGA